MEIPVSLGSTNPCPNAVHMKSFSASVFKVLNWIFATTTKICTRSCFTQVYTTSFTTNTYALLHIDTCNILHNGWVSGACLSAIHFRG